MESGTFFKDVVREDRVPSEVAFVNAFRDSVSKQGGTLLYCECTLTKTFAYWGDGGNWAFYNVSVQMNRVVIQAHGFAMLTAIAIIIVAVFVTTGTVLIVFSLTAPSILYKILGISPEDVNKYNDAQVKLWEALTKWLWAAVGLVGVAVVGMGLYTILATRRREKG